MLRITFLMLFLLEFGRRIPSVRSFQSPFPSSHLQHASTSFLEPSFTTLNMILEVEQKFRIDDNAEICSRLEELGFERKGDAVTFADWYFDELTSLHLSLQDCWLRYREMGDQGQWQLKRGQKPPQGNDMASRSTVYEEIEGTEAVDIALSMIKFGNQASSRSKLIEKVENDTMKGSKPPTLTTDQQHSLKPFVRLETTRSSWTLCPSNNTLEKYWGANIQVDLDTTNTNYAVGEVETVGETKDQVSDAQAVVESVLDQLLGNQRTDSPPIGKLEHFLIKFRPKHYQALVTAGILKDDARMKS